MKNIIERASKETAIEYAGKANIYVVHSNKDFEKIIDPDMIFFFYDENLDISRVKEIGNEETIKIGISNTANNYFDIFIEGNKDIAQEFVNNTLTVVQEPALVGFDYWDLKETLLKSNKFKINKVIGTKEQIEENMHSFKNMVSCFIIIVGGEDITLENIGEIGENIDSEHLTYSVIRNADLKEKFEVYVLASD